MKQGRVSRSLAGATDAFVSSWIGLVGAPPNGLRCHWIEAGAGLGVTRRLPSAGLHWESTSCLLGRRFVGRVGRDSFWIRGGERCGAGCQRRGRVFGMYLCSCRGTFGVRGIEVGCDAIAVTKGSRESTVGDGVPVLSSLWRAWAVGQTEGGESLWVRARLRARYRRQLSHYKLICCLSASYHCIWPLLLSGLL